MNYVTNCLTCTAMTPFGTFNGDNVLKKKAAFTLAEVLITLGIIGIVAAMTMPALIQRNINHTAEARLKKFYSVFNQAIQLAEAEYGDRTFWYSDIGGVQLDENGNPIEATAQIDIWFQKYFTKFITYKKEIKTNGSIIYYLADGSAFQFGTEDNVQTSRAVTFYIGNPDKCTDKEWGTCKFYFLYMPLDDPSPSWKYHTRRGMEPCKYDWNGTRKMLLDGCSEKNNNLHRRYCTALIQISGWTIPKDYPYKVHL